MSTGAERSGAQTAAGRPVQGAWWRLGGRRPRIPDGTGPKALLLHRAARAGLPVPVAVVVSEEALFTAIEDGVVDADPGERAGTVRVADPAAVAQCLDLPRFDGPVAVRSAFSSEDGERASQAGRYRSVLRVDAQDPGKLGAALEACWNSADSSAQGDVLRRDVLVMRMVEAQHAGVAFTEPDYEDDLVNAVQGTAERLVGGGRAGESLELPKLRRWERASGPPFDALPVWAARLARLLRGVRARFGAGPWDVEWADDGDRCWLVQLRPVTATTRRNELFTVANHREILPDPPSPLMTGVIADASPELYEYYRRLDPRLPRGRPFIEVLHGRPLINLSLLLDTMRAWGLPTRLVTGSIGTKAEREFGLRPLRALAALPALLRAGLDQLRAPSRAARAGHDLAELARNAPPGLCAQIDALRTIYVRFVQEMFALTAAMSGPLSIARRAGLAEPLGARVRTVTAELADALDELRRIAAQQPGDRAALARGELPASGGFRRAWDAFLERFGHRGAYESDVARPRYAEAPERLMRTLARAPASESGRRRPRPSILAVALAPLFAGAARATRAREALRHETMRAFFTIRRRLVAAAEEHARRGALPSAESLFWLEPDEVRRLEQGDRFDAGDLDARRALQRERADQPLPDLLRRFDPLPEPADEPSGRALQGIGLVAGVVEGTAWLMKTPDDPLPDPHELVAGARAPASPILVAPALDPGWVPLFGLFGGVAVQTGGDLSHASIVLREKGVTSVTNVSGLTGRVRSGDWLRVDGGTGRVEVLDGVDAGAAGHQEAAAAAGTPHSTGSIVR